MRHALERVRRDPIFRALNPEKRKFIVVRWLPPTLNPFAAVGIKVAALIPFTIFPHIKTIAAVQMMIEDFLDGLYIGKRTIVVPSSGNTAHAVARLARAFGFAEVKVVVSADIPDSKKGILAALSSVEIIEVGRGKSAADRAIEEAQKPDHYLLDQYRHMGNLRGHEMFTGPEILRSLGDSVSLIAVAMGSSGTAAGVGAFFKKKHPQTSVIGVRPLLGEQVPGARDSKKMAEVVTIPWEETVDAVIEVSRKDSFVGMRQLWSAVEPQPGPTSGLAWQGLRSHLLSQTPETLEKLRGTCVGFICPDDGRFYSDRTLGELDTNQGF